ncbi:DUF3179 domain-containing (seleno)protein [Halogeometricum limi]|uniref:DUF3179 domain-containing protein n=1 Tax=Halogeometricum limi TaxID=555875 RepID=A0A1I6H814_9EURY|nr:DUF3179 domain-containing (seleno)protein [Halogeometricum limi]SFR50643.1 Protein of unknown function [Halogeometricum limi]
MIPQRIGRRRLLAAVGSVGGALAGCTAPRADTETAEDPRGEASPASTATGAGGGPGTPDGVVENGFPRTLCERPPVDDVGIRAIVAPAFARDWSGVRVAERYRIGSTARGDAGGGRGATDPSDGGLSDDSVVVGVERGGDARAYPLSILWWHEVVNDEFGGPLLVTYCPICRSGMVAERLVAGRPTTFRVSGHLWRPPRIYTEASVLDGRAFGASLNDADAAVRNSGNLVLVDDATGSYWSQLLARAVCGPASGTRLVFRPSTVTTWGSWRRDHPETDVCLPPPHSESV